MKKVIINLICFVYFVENKNLEYYDIVYIYVFRVNFLFSIYLNIFFNIVDVYLNILFMLYKIIYFI